MDTESIQHKKPSGGDVAGNAGNVGRAKGKIRS